jgi:hypothetical protein
MTDDDRDKPNDIVRESMLLRGRRTDPSTSNGVPRKIRRASSLGTVSNGVEGEGKGIDGRGTLLPLTFAASGQIPSCCKGL